MKKAGVLLIVLILFLTIVSAQNATQTIDEKAFSCLKNEVEDKCDKLTLEQQIFSLLALSDNSGIQQECKSAILDKQKTDNSFGSIKDTALAVIALNYIGTNTDDETNYLLSKKKTASLEWYLEIESNSETKCKVDSSSITIRDDKKISGNPGTCFSLAYSNYWLRISDSCLNQNLTVSCDQNFISTLIYKKTGSNTWHVTSDIQSASAGGKTEHQVKSSCFSSGAGCNYEDSLWSTLAISRTGNSVSEFLPYLITYSEDNKNLFPETFLYMLTSSGEYLSQIASSQSNGKWKKGTDEYYDTALALLSLSGSEPSSTAIQWLETNQGNDGCWNNGNIRDTGFLLWAAYPKTPATLGGVSRDNCEDFDYYCVSTGECQEAKGQVLDNFYCPGLKICCDTPALQKTCSDLGGVICSSGQVCSSGTTTKDSEGKDCCLTSCRDEKPECELYSNQTCKSSCSENEEKVLYDCFSGFCCKKKPEEEKSLLWIFILIIAIILIALGIVFRKKLRIFLFKIKGGFKKGTVSRTRPAFPPVGPPQLRKMFPTRMPRQPLGLRRPVGRPGKPGTKTDKELEETMKKLKEMSK